MDTLLSVTVLILSSLFYNYNSYNNCHIFQSHYASRKVFHIQSLANFSQSFQVEIFTSILQIMKLRHKTVPIKNGFRICIFAFLTG